MEDTLEELLTKWEPEDIVIYLTKNHELDIEYINENINEYEIVEKGGY